jgi:protein TonB
MRAFHTAGWFLFIVAVLPVAADTPDAEGCKDPGLLRRASGCVIAACATKERDTITLQISAGETNSLDASIDSVTYSCPATLSPQQAARDLDGKLRAAAYQIVFEDTQEVASAGLTARKGTQWVQLNSEVADRGTTYTVAVVETDPKKPPQPKACAGPAAPTIDQRACVVVECSSGSSDAIKLHTSARGETSFKGPLVQTTLICEKSTPSQIFESAMKELRDENFEIVFEDRTRAADSWLAGRSGKRWVELTNSQEGDSMLYLLTVLPSADVVGDTQTPTPAAIPAPPVRNKIVAPDSKETVAVKSLVPHTEPAEPHPVEPKQAEPIPAPPAEPASTTTPHPAVPAPNAPTTATIPRPTLLPSGPTIPPKVLSQTRMEVPAALKKAILGQVLITLNLEIDENGQVITAALAGKITKNVQKLESAALDAVRHWKFEPARQGNQPVRGYTTVKLQFEGEPIRVNPSIH